MSMIKAVIFDFNGVIIDDEPLHEKTFRQACLELGIPLSREDFFALCLGRTEKEGVSRVQEKFKLSDEMRDELHQKKMQFYFELIKHDLRPVVGVIDLIEKLKSKFFLAIGSAATRYEIDLILKELNIREAFGVIVSAEDVAKSKPDPAPYILAARKLGVAPNECVVIEDTPSGVASAKSAGMICIAITTTRKKEELQKADFIIDAFSEIAVLNIF